MKIRGFNIFFVATAASAMPCSIVGFQDQADFSRAYKQGERSVYTVEYASGFAQLSITSDIEVTATKLLENGRAELKFHMISKRETGSTREAPMPADVTVRTIAHNLPAKYAPIIGSVDFLDLFVMVAGMTIDKKVKAGDVENWTWEGDAGSPPISIKGTTKVLELSVSQRRLVAETKGDFGMGSQHVADLTFRSTYDLENLALKASEGQMKIAKNPDTIKIVRKL